MKNHVDGVVGVSCQALFQCAGLCGWSVVKFVVCLPVAAGPLGADAFGRELS